MTLPAYPAVLDLSAESKGTLARNEIFGTGEMADRTRCFDWSKTAIGPIEQWPETLTITVNTLLGSRHPMFLWWGKERIQFYNDAYRPSLRQDKHPSALGQSCEECWPEILHIIGPQIEAVMTRGEATWHEDQLVPIYRHGKLEDVYWTYSYSPVRDIGGEICGTLVVCTETTETVIARKSLQLERKRLADLFEQAPAFFAVLDGPDHIFEMTNASYQRLIGDRSVVGKTVGDAIPETEGQGFIALLDKVYQTGKPYIGHQIPIQLARNAVDPLEKRYLNFVYQPRREADGSISGVIVLGVDVTEAKRAEEVILQSEKLAVVGRLASSIAHEINNPLEAITNLLYLSQQSSELFEIKAFLTMAEAELQRVSAIVSQTLRFHRQSTNRRAVKASELFDGTLPLYRHKLINTQVAVERRDHAVEAMMCFDGEIRQVLNNLIGNAIDAMHTHGGRLFLRSRKGRDWKDNRHGVVLTVADTGIGMSRLTLERAFEPFFTTKGIGGTGLGLWISLQIVNRHEGTLRAKSREFGLSGETGSGTVFRLFLPVDEQSGILEG